MASSEITGKKPDAFERNKTFISPSIQNLLSDSLYEESGVSYSYWKTFRPGSYASAKFLNKIIRIRLRFKFIVKTDLVKHFNKGMINKISIYLPIQCNRST